MHKRSAAVACACGSEAMRCVSRGKSGPRTERPAHEIAHPRVTSRIRAHSLSHAPTRLPPARVTGARHLGHRCTFIRICIAYLMRFTNLLFSFSHEHNTRGRISSASPPGTESDLMSSHAVHTFADHESESTARKSWTAGMHKAYFKTRNVSGVC